MLPTASVLTAPAARTPSTQPPPAAPLAQRASTCWGGQAALLLPLLLFLAHRCLRAHCMARAGLPPSGYVQNHNQRELPALLNPPRARKPALCNTHVSVKCWPTADRSPYVHPAPFNSCHLLPQQPQPTSNKNATRSPCEAAIPLPGTPQAIPEGKGPSRAIHCRSRWVQPPPTLPPGSNGSNPAQHALVLGHISALPQGNQSSQQQPWGCWSQPDLGARSRKSVASRGSR